MGSIIVEGRVKGEKKQLGRVRNGESLPAKALCVEGELLAMHYFDSFISIEIS